MTGHGTLNTARAHARDRYPDREHDTRRVRMVDADGWQAEAAADLIDAVDAGEIDADGAARYLSRMVGR